MSANWFSCKNTRILVLNETGDAIEENEIGELCVMGTCLSRGYYKASDKTASAFIQNPLNSCYPQKIYKTGDLVRYNEYHELIYVGRKDQQIKHLGHRIELGEIESAATSFPTVERCCAVYDNKNNRIILIAAPIDIDKALLYQHLKNQLPRYMLPGQIDTIEQLPLNINGKIDRLSLRNKYQSL